MASEMRRTSPDNFHSHTSIDDWEGDADPANPRNWSLPRKTVSALIVANIGFVCTLAASIYAPGHKQVASELGVSETVSLLPLSFYNLGLAFGPVISSPLSETFGRKAVYLTTLPLFDFFVIGCGFSQDITQLIVCRFFSGLFAAPAVSVAAATIADFTSPSSRAVPLAAYYSLPFVGSGLGPLIGGVVAEKQGWRWIQWTILFFAAAFHPPVLLMHESYKPIILQRRAKYNGSSQSSAQNNPNDFTATMKHFLRTTIIRPIHMLFTESTVGFVCMYAGFQFALLYTFVVASPYAFAGVYGFSFSEQSLSFLGLIVGSVIAPMPILLIDRMIYQPKLARLRAESLLISVNDTSSQNITLPPENRLYGAMIGSIILPTGLFLFAWTARPTIHWMVPIMAQGITISGSILVYASTIMFMIDTYGAKYGASASAASSLTRYTLSAAFPLFTIQFYRALGVGWATSILGFCTVLMAPIPWVFYRWGPVLRGRSAYEHGT